MLLSRFNKINLLSLSSNLSNRLNNKFNFLNTSIYSDTLNKFFCSKEKPINDNNKKIDENKDYNKEPIIKENKENCKETIKDLTENTMSNDDISKTNNVNSNGSNTINANNINNVYNNENNSNVETNKEEIKPIILTSSKRIKREEIIIGILTDKHSVKPDKQFRINHETHSHVENISNRRRIIRRTINYGT